MVKSILQYLLVLHSPNLHQCSSWHDLLIPRGGLCPWPTFHAWVSMVRKKWFSPYFSTYWCYTHQTCTNCSSWHDLLIPRGGLCPWPTFHASVAKTQNGYSRAPVMVPITIMSSYVNKSIMKVFCVFSSHWKNVKSIEEWRGGLFSRYGIFQYFNNI